LKVRMNSSLD